MSPHFHTLKRLIIGTIVILIAITAVYLLFHAGKKGIESPTKNYIENRTSREAAVYLRRHFNLVSSDEAPHDVRSFARQGFEIMIHTQTYVKSFVGNRLNCSNCHFAGGDTTGGAQGGISLSGVGAKYPAYDPIIKKLIDLPTRINNCFKRSMNGKALPLDSDLMLALVTYMQWISKNIPIYGRVPWLGLKPIEITGPANPKQGKRLYHMYCALCHHDDGEGTEINPPLWGNGSFNDAAGFNRLNLLASFIYWNMPYMDTTPVLTPEQARDVAAYILEQPRPHMEKK